MRRTGSFLIVLSILLGTLCPGVSLQLGHYAGMHGIDVSGQKIGKQYKANASHSETPDKDCIDECLSRLAGAVDNKHERQTFKPYAIGSKTVALDLFALDLTALQPRRLFRQITAFKQQIYSQTQRFRL